jgi:hypothetical protein
MQLELEAVKSEVKKLTCEERRSRRRSKGGDGAARTHYIGFGAPLISCSSRSSLDIAGKVNLARRQPISMAKVARKSP